MRAALAKRDHWSRKEGGFTLVELMIALLLGLLVMGAAITIFLSNRQAYSATEGLGRVQENVRFAFELMSRDIREVGANPCGRHVPLVNVVINSGANWWTNLNTGLDDSGELVNPWQGTLVGFTGGADAALPGVAYGDGPAQRVNGTEAIQLNSADDAVYSVQSHDPTNTRFILSTGDTNLTAGSLVIVCDARQASLFRADSVVGAVVSHAVGTQNCTENLGLPADCATATEYNYPSNAMLARMGGAQWYVGNNDRGGTSLYQSRINADGSGTTTQEIVEGVESLDFEFLQDGAADYVPTASITSPAGWADVIAVRLTLGMRTDTEGGTTDGEPLRRTLTHVVSLRSRNP